MIPLRDASRAPVRFPVVTVSLIVVNVLAFVWEVGSDEAAIIRWAVVPAELLRGQAWITPFTAMFLHGGVMHIIGNMVFLAAQSLGRSRAMYHALCQLRRPLNVVDRPGADRGNHQLLGGMPAHHDRDLAIGYAIELPICLLNCL